MFLFSVHFVGILAVPHLERVHRLLELLHLLQPVVNPLLDFGLGAAQPLLQKRKQKRKAAKIKCEQCCPVNASVSARSLSNLISENQHSNQSPV